MSYSQIHRRLKAEVCYLKPAAYNVTVSLGDKINYGSAVDLVGTSASSYSFSSSVITLPSGYWYLVKGTPMVRFTQGTDARLRYIWRDNNTSTDLGRRGTLIMQEQPHLFGGDEIAVALIDATAAAVDVALVITDIQYVHNLSNTSFITYASMTRGEIWRL